jgi:NH3-dependent NAD+ synthetase
LANYLVDYFNEEYIKESLIKSIKITPQDGLGISNNDVEQIGGKDYNEIDEILYILTENPDGIDHNKEYTEGAFDKIYNRMKNSEFKRNHPYRLERYKYEK